MSKKYFKISECVCELPTPRKEIVFKIGIAILFCKTCDKVIDYDDSNGTDSIVSEVIRSINEAFRKKYCARSIHLFDRERAIKDIEEKGRTFCDCCGVVLEWRESEDGKFEFWEKTTSTT